METKEGLTAEAKLPNSEQEGGQGKTGSKGSIKLHVLRRKTPDFRLSMSVLLLENSTDASLGSLSEKRQSLADFGRKTFAGVKKSLKNSEEARSSPSLFSSRRKSLSVAHFERKKDKEGKKKDDACHLSTFLSSNCSILLEEGAEYQTQHPASSWVTLTFYSCTMSLKSRHCFK